ncbi:MULTISPECIES: class I SAM-dependent methyltransferase [Exiguobacterium]|uniref:Ribosomal RNA small subunit methyltransferase C n=1 Tax=Exiguobacterium aurantiacum TaxID=33987 RepID=A0A377FQ05_9BACL|nr:MULTISPECIES: class I SAM-dependent methyltransferase [Exiguobacterium]STO06798.1 Ribosomal RNA small subunit methyltransferase C [Exiguobacterium aurantiacum]
MGDHYYTNDPSSKSTPETWSYELRGKTYRFTSDRGVFSKGSVDFGSRLLIESFEVPIVSGRILDVGCGYGPMGISLADASGREALLVDVNERALALSEQNATQNGVTIETRMSHAYDAVGDERFAAIVTNPPIRAGKQVVHTILRDAHDHLVVGGALYVVIQKKQGAPSAKKLLEDVFGHVETLAKEKGYFIFRAIRS